MERRVDACNKTMAKFSRKRFSLRAGRECAQMVKYHAAKLGVSVYLPAPGSYATPAAARAALAKLEAAGLPDLWDRAFERIGHASALPGDVFQLPADPEDDSEMAEFGAFVIYLGDGAVFGFHGDFPKGVVMKLHAEPIACWRVLK